MSVDKKAGERLDVPDLASLRSIGKSTRHELARLGAVKAHALPPTQGIEPSVELPLQAIDHERVEPFEAGFVQQLVKPVLPLDEKMQSPFAIPDIEREEEFGPRRQAVRGNILNRGVAFDVVETPA